MIHTADKMHRFSHQPITRRAGLTKLVAAALFTVTLVVPIKVLAQVPTTNSTQASIPAQQYQQPQQPQQQQQLTPSVPLQIQLGQIQQQAQRQLSQLNGLVLNAVSNSSRYSNVLDAISNVGKAIHQQISAATNPNHVNIITSGGSGGLAGSTESANNKKNEYQSEMMTGPSLNGPASPGMGNPSSSLNPTSTNYRDQGEFLRQEIARRAGQLQQVVASSMDLLKNNGDVIMRRLLEQMNVRLDQAKAKADKIISNEPVAMNEVTVKALATINSGLNNLNNIIANIVARMDLANKQDQQQQRLLSQGAVGETNNSPVSIQQRLQQAKVDSTLPQVLDTGRFKANLQQLSQQFQQAMNGSSLHQQLTLIRNQRLQQLAALGANNQARSLSTSNDGQQQQQQRQPQ